MAVKIIKSRTYFLKPSPAIFGTEKLCKAIKISFIISVKTIETQLV